MDQLPTDIVNIQICNDMLAKILLPGLRMFVTCAFCFIIALVLSLFGFVLYFDFCSMHNIYSCFFVHCLFALYVSTCMMFWLALDGLRSD